MGADCLIGAVHEVAPAWAAMYISEVDRGWDETTSSCFADTGDQCFRHHPGVGAIAMMWVVRARACHRIVDVQWSGRCGRLMLRTSRDEYGWTCFVTVVGWHGPHTEEEYHDSIADLTALARTRRRPGLVIITGDWTADELPRQAVGPRRERRA